MPGTSIGTPSILGHARHGDMPMGAANSSTSGRSKATGALPTGAGFGFAAADAALRDADAAGRGASIGGGLAAARSTTFGDSWTGSAWKATRGSMAAGGAIAAASDSTAS